MLKIENTKVYGIEDSVKASGYPKNINESNVDYERAKKLGSVKLGSGHDCFLKGIVVMCDIIYPEYWSPQFQRYHFADIISSQSKMHMIMEFDLDKCCNKYVDKDIINTINLYKDALKRATVKESKYYWFMKIISNLPMGFEKKMRIVTNYLQLKTIYTQRKNHKLKEDWGIFCKWILELPKFSEFTGLK